MFDAVYWLGRKVCDAMADNVCMSAADVRTAGATVLTGIVVFLFFVWVLRSGR